MLSATEAALVIRAAKALRAHNTKDDTALAAELDDCLLAATQARASVAAGQAKRTDGSRGRRPSATYALEVEPGWVEHLTGAKAAHAALVAALLQLGSGRRAPSQTSMAVQLSRQGVWTCTVDTDNGTVSLSVRRAE